MASYSSASPWPPIIPLLLLLIFLHFCFVLVGPAPTTASSPQQAGTGGNVTEAAAEAAWTPRLRKTFLDGVGHWRGWQLVGKFQVCAVCTCCGGPHGMCMPAPCCYAINCNIPNCPFGVCSFTPRACSCFNCHL